MASSSGLKREMPMAEDERISRRRIEESDASGEIPMDPAGGEDEDKNMEEVKEPVVEKREVSQDEEEVSTKRRRINGLYNGDLVVNLFESKIEFDRPQCRRNVIKELEGTPAECLFLNSAMHSNPEFVQQLCNLQCQGDRVLHWRRR